MVYLFEDQKFFLSILQETGFIRTSQVLPLLRLFDPRKTPRQAEALLHQLRYGGTLVCVGEVICLPELRNERPDADMLEALDVLLALPGEKLLEVVHRPPYQICFLLQHANDWIDAYAVMAVKKGRERDATLILNQEKGESTPLVVLEAHSQYKALSIRRSCYFVLHQQVRLHFYKGGEAGMRRQGSAPSGE